MSPFDTPGVVLTKAGGGGVGGDEKMITHVPCICKTFQRKKTGRYLAGYCGHLTWHRQVYLILDICHNAMTKLEIPSGSFS